MLRPKILPAALPRAYRQNLPRVTFKVLHTQAKFPPLISKAGGTRCLEKSSYLKITFMDPGLWTFLWKQHLPLALNWSAVDFPDSLETLNSLRGPPKASLSGSAHTLSILRKLTTCKEGKETAVPGLGALRKAGERQAGEFTVSAGRGCYCYPPLCWWENWSLEDGGHLPKAPRPVRTEPRFKPTSSPPLLTDSNWNASNRQPSRVRNSLHFTPAPASSSKIRSS